MLMSDRTGCRSRPIYDLSRSPFVGFRRNCSRAPLYDSGLCFLFVPFYAGTLYGYKKRSLVLWIIVTCSTVAVSVLPLPGAWK